MNLFQLHFILMVAAFATFWASFVIGSVYLFQESRLKGHRPLPPSLHWLPALELMGSYHYQILTVGFVLLSLGMLSGALLNRHVSGVFFNFDPREVASFVTWGIYALFLSVRTSVGWRGRKGVLLSLLGFASVALAFLALHHGGR